MLFNLYFCKQYLMHLIFRTELQLQIAPGAAWVSTAFKECLCFPGRPEISNKTPTDILPQISFSGSNDPRGQISDLPTEVTDIGNCSSFKANHLIFETEDFINSTGLDSCCFLPPIYPCAKPSHISWPCPISITNTFTLNEKRRHSWALITFTFLCNEGWVVVGLDNL